MNSSDIWNIVLGVASSAVSAVAAWLLQALLRRRRINRERAFFGLPAGSEALLVVPRKAGSTDNDRIIAQLDAYALMELAALVYECGAQYTVQPAHQIRQGIGDRAEFCIAGPSTNERTAAHLKLKFPGFEFPVHPVEQDVRRIEFVVGSETYAWQRGVADYVLLARISVGAQGRPTFLVCGQTAVSNLAAVRHLRRSYRELSHKHGTDSTFALLYKVLQPDNYGPDVIEFVADVTQQAQQAPKAPVPAPAG
ncbi:hypothetical protein [Streptacidiphilus jiangxiensis]|uniref:Secreted protein n=1 Tax=Streptacidiphilus jiangxiensis TaxID=235985 RepID=A0A1H7MFA7_STRJI|nr:hypothetical protein [Streptacidiphilus jiangxiensis]SEL09986.1 hypothetical protein SAMN05414137_105360 [Streptacidiphilus jiangxiensis]